ITGARPPCKVAVSVLYYLYPHDYPEGWVEQQYLPDGVEGRWFHLKGHGYERIILRRLRQMKKSG
ncbi:MAG: hypothetical protein ACUVSG_06510, partial [Anaerolineae bacterium]